MQKLHFQKKTKNDAAIKWASRNFLNNIFASLFKYSVIEI